MLMMIITVTVSLFSLYLLLQSRVGHTTFNQSYKKINLNLSSLLYLKVSMPAGIGRAVIYKPGTNFWIGRNVLHLPANDHHRYN